MSGKFHILYDSDWGSSGKGAAITRLAELMVIPNASCNHGPNAGHFVEDEDGARLLLKALPSPAALNGLLGVAKPKLWVGPNSGFEVDQITREIIATDYLHYDGLNIHARAVVVDQHHKDAEAPGGAQSTLHISSTMSGAGAAYSGKAMRQLDTQLAGESVLQNYCMEPEEFYWAVQKELAEGRSFLAEVAQGYQLSLDWGNHTRHGTYRNPTALQAAADMGIRPGQVGNVYCNLRTFPIRVGNNYDADGKQVGYSGEWYPDQVELDWATIGLNAGMPQAEIDALFSKELTSVTKKLRRVASFSMQSLRYSAAFNGATHLILNFTSYLDWASTDLRGGRKEYLSMSNEVRSFVEALEDEVGLPVVMLGTGAKHQSYVLPYDTIDVSNMGMREVRFEEEK